MGLRFWDKGSTFAVTVGKDEVYAFSRQWPASNLGPGPYFFEFGRNGDLVDVEGPGARSWADGSALKALSEDAERYGRCRLAQRPYGRARKDVSKCRRAFQRHWGRKMR